MGLISYLTNYVDLKKSFVFYGSYHHELKNQITHIVFVPCIFTSALAFLSHVKISKKVDASQVVAGIYASTFVAMEPCAGILYAPLVGLMQHIGSQHLAKQIPLAIGIHALGWIMQFIAHGFFEHRSPALLDDPLQAVHSAVFFVWLEILFGLGYRPQLKKELDVLIERRIAQLDAEKKQQDLGVGEKLPA